MKVYLIVATALLNLAACSDKQKSTAYLCNQQPVTLNTINNQHAELTFNGYMYLLNHEKSASGSKYINKHVLFWGKGNNAMLIVAGKKYQCTVN